MDRHTAADLVRPPRRPGVAMLALLRVLIVLMPLRALSQELMGAAQRSAHSAGVPMAAMPCHAALAVPVYTAQDLPLPAASGQGALTLQRADDQRAQAQREAASLLRERYAGYRSAFDLAQQARGTLLPLRQTIADEMLLNYDGMLVGVFELLAEARTQVGAVISTIEAQRDVWLADAALQDAIQGVLIGTAAVGGLTQPQIAPGTGAHPRGQPDDDQPPDPPARPRVRGGRHRPRPAPLRHRGRRASRPAAAATSTDPQQTWQAGMKGLIQVQ